MSCAGSPSTSSYCAGTNDSCTTPSTSASSSNFRSVSLDYAPDYGTSSKIRTSRRSPGSKVCDNCKRFKRRCDLTSSCSSCESRNDVCSYTRHSLSTKFPQMLSYDLDLISQLLNELNHDELKTSPSIKFALSQHSSRLGIDIEELLNLDVRKDKNGSSSPSSSSNSSSSSFEPAEDDVEDAKSGATYRPPSGSNSEVAQAEPCNPRQTRSTFKILDSNGTRDSCSPSPQALPSPLPPFSNRVVDPVAYHFPRHCRSGMQEGGVRG